MKILLINYEYPPVGGGAANATRQLAKALVQLGHRPFVVSAAFGDKRGRTMEDGVEVMRLSCGRKRADRASIWQMAAYNIAAAFFLTTRQGRADAALVFFSFPCGPLGWWVKCIHGVRYIISLRGGDVPGAEPWLALLHWMLTPLRRLVHRGSIAVVANSAGLARMAEQADPLPVQVIPNGVDAEFFSPVERPAQRAAIRMLFVGRFQEQKNLPFVLARLAAVQARLATPIEFVLVGDGPLRAELETKARALGLEKCLQWRGWLDREALREEYQNSDFLVNLSRYEGMPNVVLEAMACGLPVLVSATPGHDELVEDGVTGFIRSLDASGEIEEAMVRLATDGELRASLGGAAARMVKERLSWESTALSYLQLFKKASA